jgi:peptide subunit release factor 1 (eRF1)
VAGTERDLAYFDDVTRHHASVVGRLTGNHEDTNPDELARLAAPLLDDALASRRAEVVDELVEAIGPGRGIVGIKPVWDATLGGRARVLLVEEDFVYPARVVDGRLEPSGDPDRPGVIDDAVDELIELALDRDGDVVIVEPGALGAHGPVAALLRY